MEKPRGAWMQRLFGTVCGVLVAGVLAGSAVANAGGTRMDVLLWPSGGRMEVVQTLPVRDMSVSFTLPAGAQLDTLHLRVDGASVVHRETLPVDSVNPALAGLKAALQEARTQAARVEGEMAAAQARIALWSGGSVLPNSRIGAQGAAVSVSSVPVASVFSVEERQKLDTALGARLTELYVQLAALEPQRVASARQVALLEQELERKGDRLEATRVTAQLALANADRSVPAGKEGTSVAAQQEVTVHYSCTLGACGWKPVYRLDALPDKGLVLFAQEAEIIQSTGQDWDGVDLTLASVEPGSALAPAPLRDWRVQPVRRLQPRSAQVMAAAALGKANSDQLLRSSVVGSAVEQATFTTWHLGAQRVRAGVPVRLELGSGDWKATFVRVARPSTGRVPARSGGNARQATYLMAEVTLPEAQEYPLGAAQFLVDGVPVGMDSFSFVGDRKELFFGTDARVTTQMTLDTRQSGSKGFVDKQQTWAWAWNIDVHNSHSKPVLVRVEDPEPQSGDTAITLQVTSTPKPKVEDHAYVWTRTVPAGGTASITHTVEASAPKDMPLYEGR